VVLPMTTPNLAICACPSMAAGKKEEQNPTAIRAEVSSKGFFMP